MQEAEAEVEALPVESSAGLSAKECLLVQVWRERRPRGRDCPKAKVQLVLKSPGYRSLGRLEVLQNKQTRKKGWTVGVMFRAE